MIVKRVCDKNVFLLLILNKEHDKRHCFEIKSPISFYFFFSPYRRSKKTGDGNVGISLDKIKLKQAKRKKCTYLSFVDFWFLAASCSIPYFPDRPGFAKLRIRKECEDKAEARYEKPKCKVKAYSIE